jgi:lipopolysaccharide/colanic/teichoic acid biosynthesis glycosyltransferase
MTRLDSRTLPRSPFLDVLTAPTTRARGWLERFGLRTHLAMMDVKPRVRRAFDVFAVSFGLLFIGPLLLVAAVAIKLDSKGPVFFRQERVGQNGRRFAMFKLRTMVVNADALKDRLEKENATALDGVRFKMKADPRITRVGRVLRRFSVDEMPQLWNVLRGDMTLIGPRPAVMREVAQYDVRALRRLEVPQGLTCFWQVQGRSDLSFEEQVELDVQYIDRARATDSVRILLKTVPAVLTGRGAR